MFHSLPTSNHPSIYVVSVTLFSKDKCILPIKLTHMRNFPFTLLVIVKGGGSSHGIVDKVLDCDIGRSEFKLLLHYYIPF